MFSLADVMHLFAHELSGLGRWRVAFRLIFFRSFDSFFFRHGWMYFQNRFEEELAQHSCQTKCSPVGQYRRVANTTLGS